MFQRYLIWLVLCAAACTAQEAEKELFSARFKKAADLYGKILANDPADPRAYYGLIRSLIEDHRSQERIQRPRRRWNGFLRMHPFKQRLDWRLTEKETS